MGLICFYNDYDDYEEEFRAQEEERRELYGEIYDFDEMKDIEEFEEALEETEEKIEENEKKLEALREEKEEQEKEKQEEIDRIESLKEDRLENIDEFEKDIEKAKTKDELLNIKSGTIYEEGLDRANLAFWVTDEGFVWLITEWNGNTDHGTNETFDEETTINDSLRDIKDFAISRLDHYIECVEEHYGKMKEGIEEEYDEEIERLNRLIKKREKAICELKEFANEVQEKIKQLKKKERER